jgi:uncharacterized membrane protein
MKGIQNKIIISQKAFIIHIYGLHYYKRKLSKLFSEYIIFSVNFNVGALGGTTNIHTISTSDHVAFSMFGVTVATQHLMGAFRC